MVHSPLALKVSFYTHLPLPGEFGRDFLRLVTRRRYLGGHNRKLQPFIWTADPDRIIEKVNRRYHVIVSDH